MIDYFPQMTILNKLLKIAFILSFFTGIGGFLLSFFVKKFKNYRKQFLIIIRVTAIAWFIIVLLAQVYFPPIDFVDTAPF